MSSTRGGASKREGRSVRGMTQRKLLRDHPAHRYPEHVRARNFELLEQPGGVVGKHLDRVRRIGLVALPGAAIVKRDHAKSARELLDQLGIPCRRARA